MNINWPCAVAIIAVALSVAVVMSTCFSRLSSHDLCAITTSAEKCNTEGR